jgi:hypothetical protein
MQISTQLFIGAQARKDFSLEQIKQRIASAKKYANIQRVMIWVDEPKQRLPESLETPGVFQDIVQICRAYDIETYLWFPMLADIPGYDAPEEALVASYTDNRGYGEIGRWEQLGAGDEKFLFLCPNNIPESAWVFRLYKNLVDLVDFNGVFLDRIRYPSCTNGFESLFTCFCDFCQEKFAARYGVALHSFKPKIADFVESLKQITAQELHKYDRLESLWQSAGLDRFFEFRNQNIAAAVKKFSEYARSKHKQVGLDLYTPSLAPFVSQDYQLLSQYCDWMKPMSYCHVIGPAGAPLEICCIIQALEMFCPNVSERDLIEFFERVLGVTLPKSKQAILAQGIPETFVAKELAKIRNLPLPENIRIYPGVEAVKNPHFALNIDRDILERYLVQIQPYAPGFIASWNLLYIPDENWEIIGQK